MAKVKPKLDALKAKWSKDPKRFREEQVKLYREPRRRLSDGCLMLNLQMPIFFALVLVAAASSTGCATRRSSGCTTSRGPTASSTSAATSWGSAGFPRALPLDQPPPVIYIGLSVWQQRLMPKPLERAAEAQMRTARWMTILFPDPPYNYNGRAGALHGVLDDRSRSIEGRIVRAIDDREQAANA